MDPLKSLSTSGASKKALSLIEEFKAFALKGNVIDLAVGVIIGMAFGKIITSLVSNVIMPLIGVILPGERGYLGWSLTISGKEIPYGQFLGAVVEFLLIAGALFIFIRVFLGFVLRTKQVEATAPPPPTKDQELLTEIRDLLKQSVGRVESSRPVV